MAKPLGIIVDQNPNEKASDVYALVLNNTVVSMIISSLNGIQSIYPNFDYSVDVTMQGQPGTSVGWTYNASQDQFLPPPPPIIDWVQNVRVDFDNMIVALQQITNDCGISGGSLNPTQINAAYNSALNDNPGLDQPTLTLLLTIYNYIVAGG